MDDEELSKTQLNIMAHTMHQMLMEEDEKNNMDVKKMEITNKDIYDNFNLIDKEIKEGKKFANQCHRQDFLRLKRLISMGKQLTQTNKNRIKSIYEAMEQKEKSDDPNIDMPEQPYGTEDIQEKEPFFEDASNIIAGEFSGANVHTFKMEKPTRIEIQRIENGFIITIGNEIHCMSSGEILKILSPLLNKLEAIKAGVK